MKFVKPTDTKIVVVIPAYNEEQSIGKVVQEIPRDWVDAIIVVNNNSTDHTEKVAEDAGAIVLVENRKGYGWACLKGIAHAKKLQADLIVFMDGDFSDYPQQLPDLVAPIFEQGMDMVIGSRALGNREKGSMTMPQLFGNWLATRLMRLFYGVRYTDLGPFRAITISALERLQMHDKTYGWTIEMQIKAAKQQLNATEVSVDYKNRIGKSKVSGTVKGTVMAGYKILFAVLKYKFTNH
jgi:glycosyltransferase involved in cell wall biosynthesis